MTIGKLNIFIIFIFSVLVYFLVNEVVLSEVTFLSPLQEKPELSVIIKMYKYKIWHTKFFQMYIIDSEILKEV